jgi:hypothetical protein
MFFIPCTVDTSIFHLSVNPTDHFLAPLSGDPAADLIDKAIFDSCDRWLPIPEPPANKSSIASPADPELTTTFILWSANQIIFLDNSFLISLAIFLGLFSSFLIILIIPWWSPHRDSPGSSYDPVIPLPASPCHPLSLFRRREALHAGTHFRKGGRRNIEWWKPRDTTQHFQVSYSISSASPCCQSQEPSQKLGFLLP